MNNGNTNTALLEKTRKELSRGLMTLAVLSRLNNPHYGYSLQKDLQESGFTISQDTLYPLLRRLESLNLLVSSWVMEEPRPRKYYQLNPAGTEMYEQLKLEWQSINTAMKRILI